MTIGVVVNPAAGGGQLRAAWPALAAVLEQRLGPLAVLFTSGPGQGAELAQQHLRNGARMLIAAGGDGTTNETVDGILRVGGTPELGIIPVGTGRDFIRTLGMERNQNAAVEALCTGRTRQVDAGRVTYTGDDGKPGVRHFLNVASLGVSGPTVRAVNASKRAKRLPPKLAFYVHTLAEMMKYRPQDVRVRFEDGTSIDVRTALVVIANGRYFGGGMMIAPDASLDDGLFDVLVYRAEGKLRMLFDFNLIYKGAHTKLPRVTIKRTRSVEVTAIGGPKNAAILDIDGESPGRIAAKFEVLPKALTLRA
ncbi:MAG: diacylglycerol kinase family protein [Devosia sp.]